MKAVVKNIDNKEVGSMELLDLIFGVEPRRDILTRIDPVTVHNTADVYFLGFIKVGEVDLTMTRKTK